MNKTTQAQELLKEIKGLSVGCGKSFEEDNRENEDEPQEEEFDEEEEECY